MTVKLININFSYTGTKKVIDDFSLELTEGNIYALMGANGAGKSTLFNIINGFIKPQSGNIIFNETDITKFSPYKRNLIGIGRTFQDLRLITTISVKENILLSFKNNLSDKWHNAILKPNKLKLQQIELEKRTREIIQQFHLEEVESNLASDISFGQQKLLSLACCVANDAQLLLLDEPVAGVNPVYREQLTEILLRLKQQGKIILLIEHNTDFINQVADSICFMAYGQKHNFKNIAEMKQSEIVLNAYL
ncbi:MAG: ATP-binding cassette domain-containing protein [Chitinophagales bacterium]|nr:ATP-binding cassette domain-containing protein [Chitinophagales bacterium]